MRYIITMIFCLIALNATSFDSVTRDIQSKINLNISGNKASAYETPHSYGITGGSLNIRVPNSGAFSLLNTTPPSIKMGCNGIDIVGGSLNFISGGEIVKKLESIIVSSAIFATKSAIMTSCPTCASIMDEVDKLSNTLNSMSLDSCAIAQNIAGGTISEKINNAAALEVGSVVASEGGSSSIHAFMKTTNNYAQTIKEGINKVSSPYHKKRIQDRNKIGVAGEIKGSITYTTNQKNIMHGLFGSSVSFKNNEGNLGQSHTLPNIDTNLQDILNAMLVIDNSTSNTKTITIRLNQVENTNLQAATTNNLKKETLSIQVPRLAYQVLKDYQDIYKTIREGKKELTSTQINKLTILNKDNIYKLINESTKSNGNDQPKRLKELQKTLQKLSHSYVQIMINVMYDTYINSLEREMLDIINTSGDHSLQSKAIRVATARKSIIDKTIQSIMKANQ